MHQPGFLLSPTPLLQDRDKAESVLVDQGRQHQAAEERTREIYEVGPFLWGGVGPIGPAPPPMSTAAP